MWRGEPNVNENEPVSRVNVDVDVDVRGPTHPNPRAYICSTENDQVSTNQQVPDTCHVVEHNKWTWTGAYMLMNT